MTMHIFIVDDTTFPIHLKYMFAGTGCKLDKKLTDCNIDFTKFHHNTERNLMGMIADANRIRTGDKIIFYKQANGASEGKFYGIFKAKSESFLEYNGGYLEKDLNKTLLFRTLIEPDEVYSDGISEWEALDKLPKSKKITDMIWSLIYRKLRGNRGNTMITLNEEKNLCFLLKNNNTKLKNTKNYSFENDQIKSIGSSVIYKSPRTQIKLDTLPRLITKHSSKKAFESHLQAYLTSAIDKNAQLKKIFNFDKLNWLGNEVFCGVGMQRIDILLQSSNNLYPIELKDECACKNITKQLQRYMDWLLLYYIPSISFTITPAIISERHKDNKEYLMLIDAIKNFNRKNKNNCKPIKYIEFTISDNNIKFDEIKY